MTILKTNALTSVSTNTDLTLSANGTGAVKIDDDYFQLAKGSDISSDASLSLGTDGNAFDVTGTTTITSIGTQGIGSHITLHFDGALTLTHHATNLILPGAANITTAAGDIATLYEYASADWRCVSYTTASGVPAAPLTTAVVNAGENIFIVLDGTNATSDDAGDNVIDETDSDDIIGEDEVLLHTGMQRNVLNIMGSDGTIKNSFAAFAPGVI